MQRFLNICMIAAACAAASCSKVVSPPVPVAPLYTDLDEWDSRPASWRDSVMTADSAAIGVMFSYLNISDNPTDTLLSQWSQSRAVQAFTPPTLAVYPNLDNLETQIGQIAYNARKAKLDIPSRTYAAVVWGNTRSMVLTDSVMLIALNHYLGADFEGYASLPEYLRQSKTPQRLPIDIAEALIKNRYPFQTDSSTTVLSRMLYEGAVLMAKIKLLPDYQVAEVMGYSDHQLKWLTANSSQVWNALVSKQMLYSKSTLLADELINPAPGTLVLGPDVPPRAGRYVGYSIVESYLLANQATPLSELLSPSFYNNPSVLIESAYQ